MRHRSFVNFLLLGLNTYASSVFCQFPVGRDLIQVTTILDGSHRE